MRGGRKPDPKKDLPNMRNEDEKKEVQWETGRFGSVQAQSVLQSGMHGKGVCQGNSNSRWSEGERQEVEREQLRDVRNKEKSTITSYRHESIQQCAREYYDTLHFMPYKIPLDDGKGNTEEKEICELTDEDIFDLVTQGGYWDTEPDIPRIATGIPNRVGRLKALGNAVVPQQFYPIFKAIAAIESTQEETDGK